MDLNLGLDPDPSFRRGLDLGHRFKFKKNVHIQVGSVAMGPMGTQHFIKPTCSFHCE